MSGDEPAGTVSELAWAIAERIRSGSPIGFDEFVAHALYAPGLGFYTSDQGDRGAGRRRDFLTSPEVGPLFGAIVARALDTWWEEMGRPNPYPVVEAGAGPGTLARAVLAAQPDCADALRLVLVEVGEPQWAAHPDDTESRADLPVPGELGTGPVVVVANELLDNLPFGLVELVQPALEERPGAGGRQREDSGRAASWCEVLVDVAEAAAPEPQFVERFARLDPARQGWCWGRTGRTAPVGTRLPVQAEAAAWLGEALDLAAGGRVVVFDYASTTGELARRPWTEWVRTYAGHARGGHPMEHPGAQDITCEVAVDQLATVARPALDRTQADFLRAHGLDEVVADGRRRWAEQGISGGLDAIAARSTITEAEALVDPAGLGAFRVLEWTA